MADATTGQFRTVTPHLVVKGCEAAIDFYTKAFGAVERSRLMWPGPDGVDKVGHAEMTFGDSVIMLADEFPEHGSIAPTGPGASVTIHLMVPDVDASYAQAVEAGATGVMPPENMFWGDRYGKLIDPFGHHWSVATHLEDVTTEQMKERMAAMFAASPDPCA